MGSGSGVEGTLVRIISSFSAQEKVQNPESHGMRQPSKQHVSTSFTLAFSIGMAVGGILGGVIGHQVGKGSGKKLATALGAIIGAGIGHDAVNGHVQSSQRQRYTEYQEQCEVQHQVSYDEVVDGYAVTYRYQGERYHIEMPYHPGKRIKLRISVMY